MIPPLDQRGYLPSGLHRAAFDEVRDRFGKESELRQVQTESLGWLVDLARRAGVRRLVINGSFTTGALEPNDVDCVLLVDDDFPHAQEAEAELRAGLPFLSIDMVRQADFDILVQRFFATDRQGIPKGMVEIIL